MLSKASKAKLPLIHQFAIDSESEWKVMVIWKKKIIKIIEN